MERILPGLGQLNWAAYHRQRAIKAARCGDRDLAYIEKQKAFGSIWWSRQNREDFLAKQELRDLFLEAA